MLRDITASIMGGFKSDFTVNTYQNMTDYERIIRRIYTVYE